MNTSGDIAMELFDYSWTTGDCEVVFRITYDIGTNGEFYVFNFDVDCIDMKLQDENAWTWYDRKDGGLGFIPPDIAMAMEERFKDNEHGLGEEAIEALCRADYDSESDDDNQTQGKDDERDND